MNLNKYFFEELKESHYNNNKKDHAMTCLQGTGDWRP